MTRSTDGQAAELALCAPVEMLQAEAVPEGGAPALRRFSMNAYTGGAMTLRGWRHPTVIDLAGISWSAKARPILKDHNPSLIVGHTEGVSVVDGVLRVAGVVSGAGPVAREIVEAGMNGFPWQASVGAYASETEQVPKGRQAIANGRTFDGPVSIVRRSVLGEVSFVALGADDGTEARIAAEAAGNEEEHTMSEAENVAQAAAPAAEIPSIAAQMRAEAAAESARIGAIRKACAGQHAEIEAKAIADGWDATKAELEVLRASRPLTGAPAAHVRGADASPEVVEAALCKAGGLPGIERHYDERTLEAADRRWRHGLGLQEALLEAAWAGGHTGRSVKGDTRGVLQAAFSNFSLPGIFSNVANKFLLAGFTAVEGTWREISSSRSVSDFKQVTSYRLNGAFAYDEIGPAGELKAGDVSEESFTNQVKTYGKMFSVTRQDIINDDLGALSALPTRIGRGAALKLNQVFWAAFLANSSFYTTARKNYASGATTAFGIDSLTAAEQLFLDQVDTDGQPLAISPAVLLVPTALNAKAAQLMNATELRDTTASTKYPTANPHAGKFRTLYSAYLSNSTLTGNSSTAWYLLANPADLPVIEMAFLNGKEVPTVETAEADFNMLGIRMRGYHDFGVNLQDPRGGVKSKGEV
ncbi:MAG: hypothetical protein RIT25_1868 [Planctomycetota bacterium]